MQQRNMNQNGFQFYQPTPHEYSFALPASMHKIGRSDKKNNKDNKLKLKFEELNYSVLKFLRYLQNTYEEHNIYYDVQKYYSTLVRLLVPNEILSATSPNFENGSIKNKKNQKVVKIEYENRAEQYQINYQNNQQIFKGYEKMPESPKIRYQQKRPFPPKLQMKPQKPIVATGGKPLLPAAVQKKLALWVLQSYCQGIVVKMKQISNKCLDLIGNHNGFTGSTGWANKFLHRHQILKSTAVLVRSGNIQQVISRKSAIIQEIERVYRKSMMISQGIKVTKQPNAELMLTDVTRPTDQAQDPEDPSYDYEQMDSQIASESENGDNQKDETETKRVTAKDKKQQMGEYEDTDEQNAQSD